MEPVHQQMFKNVFGGLRKVESRCEHMKTCQKESLGDGQSCFDCVMGSDGVCCQYSQLGPFLSLLTSTSHV